MTVTIADCRCVVGTYYRVPKEKMLGPITLRSVSGPRQIAMALAREFTGRSTPSIGQHFGGRDHTTVIYASNVVRKREAESERIRGDMENFRLTLLTYGFQKGAGE